MDSIPFRMQKIGGSSNIKLVLRKGNNNQAKPLYPGTLEKIKLLVEMNNDIMINQARHLYAVLHVEQHALSIENKTRSDRLDRIVRRAYRRYQRRLNRCVLCYQRRLNRPCSPPWC